MNRAYKAKIHTVLALTFSLFPIQALTRLLSVCFPALSYSISKPFPLSLHFYTLPCIFPHTIHFLSFPFLSWLFLDNFLTLSPSHLLPWSYHLKHFSLSHLAFNPIYIITFLHLSASVFLLSVKTGWYEDNWLCGVRTIAGEELFSLILRSQQGEDAARGL